MPESRCASGPLAGVRVLEFAGLGPAPFAGMMLSDMGADVLRIDRPDSGGPVAGVPASDLLGRNRRSLVADLKQPAVIAAVLDLVDAADALIEGYRPGVMEDLGLGPEECHARNPRLVYGRMTGWGQDGPWADVAGHDINYIALTGALHAIGTPERPVPPLNLLGDFGGGGMLLAYGVVCALFEASRSGSGQVVDAAITEGVALLMSITDQLRAGGAWDDAGGPDLFDGGAPF